MFDSPRSTRAVATTADGSRDESHNSGHRLGRLAVLGAAVAVATTIAAISGVSAASSGSVSRGESAAVSAPSTRTSSTPREAGRPSVASMVAGLREMNYFPANQGWQYMWLNWDAGVFQADMQRIAALGANTVRIIVNTSAFGYPVPSQTMLARLQSAISIAAAAGVQSHITLFDEFYGYSDISGSQQWATSVLAAFAGDARVAAVELQNEVNPQNSAAVSWAAKMVPFLRSVSGGIPVTLSVLESGPAHWMGVLKGQLGASAQPDFWDVHIYADPGIAYATMMSEIAVAAPLPAFVGETGYDTSAGNTQFSGVAPTQASQEAFQAQFLLQYYAAARQAGLAPPAPWMLYDVSNQQFGLFHKDGTAKPAASVVSAAFLGQPLSTAFNNGFETAAGSIPAVWRTWRLPNGTYARDSTVSHSGAASARLMNTGTAAGGAIFTETVSPLMPGSTHTVSAWVLGLGATGSTYVGIQWLDLNGRLVAGTSSAPLSVAATGWQLLGTTGTAPPNAVYAQVVLVSSNNAGSAWFDDVSFT